MCAGNELGERYIDTTVGTSGLTLDLCLGTWGTFLESIVSGSTTAVNTFYLSADPIEETLSVYVDSMWDTRWTYYPSPPRIIFDADAVPSSLASVEIIYSTWPDCEN